MKPIVYHLSKQMMCNTNQAKGVETADAEYEIYYVGIYSCLGANLYNSNRSPMAQKLILQFKEPLYQTA